VRRPGREHGERQRAATPGQTGRRDNGGTSLQALDPGRRSMFVAMRFALVPLVHVVMGAVFAMVLVLVGPFPGSMSVGMLVLMHMFVGMLMHVLVGVLAYAGMLVLMLVFVGMLMAVLVAVFVVALHKPSFLQATIRIPVWLYSRHVFFLWSRLGCFGDRAVLARR
jgi:hypothetical protein